MNEISYIIRCVIVVFFSWIGVRMIGKKSISQMTSYDLATLMIIANVAAEPLVFKVTSKAFIGSMVIALIAMGLGYLSLNKKYYNFDMRPDILVLNGKIDKEALKTNRMNLPFLLSLLRVQGYSCISDVEFAILEPSGNLSVIPKSQNRPITPKDLKINTPYEGLSLPLIIDGEIQYNNLRYANLEIDWLNQEIKNMGATSIEEIFLAELKTSGELSVYFDNNNIKRPPII